MNTFPDHKPGMGGGALPAAKPKSQGGATVTEDELQEFAREIGAIATPVATLAAGSEASGHPPRGEPFRAAAAQVSRPVTAVPATLKTMLRTMEGFLARHAGLDGLPLAIVFEQITSIAQLRTELPAYFELIKSYGADARAHEKELAELLGQPGG